MRHDLETMKLVVALVTSLALVSPALACPNMDHDEAPKTADKKAPDKSDKKQEAPKTDPAKNKEQAPADTAKNKDGKGEQKKPGDKVSLK